MNQKCFMCDREGTEFVRVNGPTTTLFIHVCPDCLKRLRESEDKPRELDGREQDIADTPMGETP